MAPERCAQCGGEASQRCGGCQQVFYCCRDHQRAHWSTHRPLCRPFKVGQDAVVGRYLCASRDIAAGELVLREPPLVWGPSQATPAVCLGCYVVLEAASCVRCDRCGWPMCSQHCANSLDHRPECDITADVRGAKVSISSFGQEHPTYQCVTALRALRLRTADPARWQKLWALESHCAHRRGTPSYEADRVAVAQFVRRFFKMTDFSEEDILRVCGILQVNGHEVPLTEPSYVSVYEWASLLEHSCRANCSKSFSEAGELLLRAAAPIARGQRLTICYSDSLWGTASRRQHLRETKFFWCRCARCTDPTEMGTFFSALRCPQPGCEGVCVPAEESLQQEPEDEQEEPPWWCRSCQQPMAAAKVLQQLEAAGAELSALPRGDAERCWQFVRRHEAVARLADDHFYLTEARLALAQLLGQGPAGVAALPEDHLRAKEALCRRLLRLVTVLCPGSLSSVTACLLCCAVLCGVVVWCRQRRTGCAACCCASCRRRWPRRRGAARPPAAWTPPPSARVSRSPASCWWRRWTCCATSRRCCQRARSPSTPGRPCATWTSPRSAYTARWPVASSDGASTHTTAGARSAPLYEPAPNPTVPPQPDTLVQFRHVTAVLTCHHTLHHLRCFRLRAKLWEAT